MNLTIMFHLFILLYLLLCTVIRVTVQEDDKSGSGGSPQTTSESSPSASLDASLRIRLSENDGHPHSAHLHNHNYNLNHTATQVSSSAPYGRLPAGGFHDPKPTSTERLEGGLLLKPYRNFQPYNEFTPTQPMLMRSSSKNESLDANHDITNGHFSPSKGEVKLRWPAFQDQPTRSRKIHQDHDYELLSMNNDGNGDKFETREDVVDPHSDYNSGGYDAGSESGSNPIYDKIVDRREEIDRKLEPASGYDNPQYYYNVSWVNYREKFRHPPKSVGPVYDYTDHNYNAYNNYDIRPRERNPLSAYVPPAAPPEQEPRERNEGYSYQSQSHKEETPSYSHMSFEERQPAGDSDNHNSVLRDHIKVTKITSKLAHEYLTPRYDPKRIKVGGVAVDLLEMNKERKRKNQRKTVSKSKTKSIAKSERKEAGPSARRSISQLNRRKTKLRERAESSFAPKHVNRKNDDDGNQYDEYEGEGDNAKKVPKWTPPMKSSSKWKYGDRWAKDQIPDEDRHKKASNPVPQKSPYGNADYQYIHSPAYVNRHARERAKEQARQKRKEKRQKARSKSRKNPNQIQDDDNADEDDGGEESGGTKDRESAASKNVQFGRRIRPKTRAADMQARKRKKMASRPSRNMREFRDEHEDEELIRQHSYYMNKWKKKKKKKKKRPPIREIIRVINNGTQTGTVVIVPAQADTLNAQRAADTAEQVRQLALGPEDPIFNTANTASGANAGRPEEFMFSSGKTVGVFGYDRRTRALTSCRIFDSELDGQGLASVAATNPITARAIDVATMRALLSRCGDLDRRRMGLDLSANRGARGLLNQADVLFSEALSTNTSFPWNGFRSNWRGTITGSEWCGRNVSPGTGWETLGQRAEIDICCRAHYYCPVRVRPFRVDYGIINLSLNMRTHCDCETDLFRCLREANSADANALGGFYFNVLRNSCLEEQRSLVCDQLALNNIRSVQECLRFSVTRNRGALRLVPSRIVF